MQKLINIIEKLKIDSKSKVHNTTEILDKWGDKCKDLSCSGTFGLTSGHLTPKDFEGFTDDMINNFVPEGKSRWGDICRARYEIIQSVINKDIDKMIKIIKDNNFDYLFACEHPDSKYVYGSHLLDCWLAFELYNYINEGSKSYNTALFSVIFRLDEDMDWVNSLKDSLNKLKR
jgi:hypothetical protein